MVGLAPAPSVTACDASHAEDSRLFGPDLTAAPPADQQIEWLDAVIDDPERYALVWLAAVATIGSAYLMVERDGTEVMSTGVVADGQERERSKRLDALSAHLRAAGHRAAVFRLLQIRGPVMDQRLANPRETTRVLRDFLRVGNRLLIDPDGHLMEGSELPRFYIDGEDADRVEWKRAGRAYFAARRRWRADRQIRRAIRMLGKRTNNGWMVLEARS